MKEINLFYSFIYHFSSHKSMWLVIMGRLVDCSCAPSTVCDKVFSPAAPAAIKLHSGSLLVPLLLLLLPLRLLWKSTNYLLLPPPLLLLIWKSIPFFFCCCNNQNPLICLPKQSAVQKSLTAIKSSNKSPSLHKYLCPNFFPSGQMSIFIIQQICPIFHFRHSSTSRIGRVFGKVFMQCSRPR